MADALPPAPPLRADCALFLDFDGTLAPIQDDPDTVALPQGGAQVLRALAKRLAGALVIISGRALTDLAERVPQDLWRIGTHGLEVAVPGDAPPAALARTPDALGAALHAATHDLPGVRIETKGAVLAVHYRAAPDAEGVLAQRLTDVVSQADGYRLQHGKMVFEAKPTAANKGLALQAMMAREGFAGRIPVMVGDDTTDEDAMAAALAAGGLAVKVGAGPTQATHRVAAPADVWAWLKGAAG